MRRVLAALIVIGLAVGVVLLWPRATTEEAPTTLASPTTTASTSTTTPPPTSTSATVPDSTTTTADSNVVETVEEAEAILRELWFGWFEGIYNEDEDRIREVVVLEETVETAKESFGVEFERAPQPEDISFGNTEILRSDDSCLAVWTTLTTSGFREGSSDGVEILRWTSDGWKSLSTWTSRNDLWETDCDSSL